MFESQSRQSAKLLSSRRNWDSPNPSLAGERGVGMESPNSGEGTYTLVLFIYTYFVVRVICKERDEIYSMISFIKAPIDCSRIQAQAAETGGIDSWAP